MTFRKLYAEVGKVVDLLTPNPSTANSDHHSSVASMRVLTLSFCMDCRIICDVAVTDSLVISLYLGLEDSILTQTKSTQPDFLALDLAVNKVNVLWSRPRSQHDL